MSKLIELETRMDFKDGSRYVISIRIPENYSSAPVRSARETIINSSVDYFIDEDHVTEESDRIWDDDLVWESFCDRLKKYFSTALLVEVLDSILTDTQSYIGMDKNLTYDPITLIPESAAASMQRQLNPIPVSGMYNLLTTKGIWEGPLELCYGYIPDSNFYQGWAKVTK